MQKLRRLGPEQLEGRLVAGQQRCGKLPLPFLHEPVQAAVHNCRARPLVGSGECLLVAEPEQKFIHIQKRPRRRVGERLKFVLRAAL